MVNGRRQISRSYGQSINTRESDQPWFSGQLSIDFESSYNPEASQGMRYSHLTADDISMEDFDDPKNMFEHYALMILGKTILLEERVTGRMSGLRVFCRLDISVFRERETGKHSFFVNEITRSHGTALFVEWITHGLTDPFFHHLSDILHLVAAQKLFLTPPTLP
jgi:hypothetical protein